MGTFKIIKLFSVNHLLFMNYSKLNENFRLRIQKRKKVIETRHSKGSF